MIYGYARAATGDQALEQQIAALKAAGCGIANIVRENVSDARARRPRLMRLLESIGPDDLLMVTRLDRVARSTRDLHNILDRLARRSAGFRSLAEAWADTTMAHCSLLLAMLAGLAEFERDLIGARLRDGRARAKARGEHIGRPLALSAQQRRKAVRTLRAGTTTQAALARELNVSQATISKLAGEARSLSPPAEPTPDAHT